MEGYQTLAGFWAHHNFSTLKDRAKKIPIPIPNWYTLKWKNGRPSLALNNLLLHHCSHLDNFSPVTFQSPQQEGQNVCKRPPQVNCTNISSSSNKNKQKIAKPNLN
jgi:hypothetical protein